MKFKSIIILLLTLSFCVMSTSYVDALTSKNILDYSENEINLMSEEQ